MAWPSAHCISRNNLALHIAQGKGGYLRGLPGALAKTLRRGYNLAMFFSASKLASGFARDPAWAFFRAFVLLSMLSTPAARAALAASLLCLLFDRTRRGRLRPDGPAAGWLCYLALAATATAVFAAIDADPLLVPRSGLGKVTKLMWFASIPVAAANVTCAGRLRDTVGLLALGGLLLALSVVFLDTSFAWLQVHYPHGAEAAGAPVAAAWLHSAASALNLHGALDRALCADVWKPWGGRPPCFLYALTFNATLHDAQRLMVALAASVAMGLSDVRAGRARRLLVPAIIAAGLVLTCKRGPLIGAMLSAGILLSMRAGLRRAALALAGIALLAIAVPQSRARLAMLPSEFSLRSGGRALMWTKIVPELHRQHPWGIGFRALTDAKMRSIDRRVEPNRTHVHSTPLEAFVDFSWPGLAAWALWMWLCLAATARLARGGGPCPNAPPTIRAFPLAAFSGLFAVSLIEYNIGDAAVVLLYGTVIGAAGCRRNQPDMIEYCP